MIYYLLYATTLYLSVTSLILLRNRVNFTHLGKADDSFFSDRSPRVSICIPARNEERTIEKCVTSALNQDYPNLEVLVLDDGSEDNTRSLLSAIDHPRNERLTTLDGAPKPDGWLGKPWACHQLGRAASGDILIFVDADVWLAEDTAARVVRTMGRDVVDFLTIWPRQVLGSYTEKTVLPLIYHALLSVLPVRSVHRTPRWIPGWLKQQCDPLFAAACGQFMAFKQDPYLAIGGHEAVKAEVVEDVALARLVKKRGYRMRMYYGGESVVCRMYRSGREVREGLRKNFLAGFGYSVPLFIAAGLLHFIVFLLPPALFIAGAITGNTSLLFWAAVPLAIILVQRLLLSSWFGWSFLHAFLHPLGVLWFQRLGATVLRDYCSGRKTSWKGRSL